MPDIRELFVDRTKPMNRLHRMAMSVVVIALVYVPRIYGLEIDLIYQDGFEQRTEAVALMEMAAAAWEQRLTDPVTVAIDVRAAPVVELGFAAGFTFAEIGAYAYAPVRQVLIDDVTTPFDQLAVDHLPMGPLLTFRTLTPEGERVVSSGNDAINRFVIVTNANAKALDIPVRAPEVPDAEIQWNEFFLDELFDFDQSDGVDGTDFLSAAKHEIGHALGFFSGVDDIDYFSLPGGPGAPRDLSEFAVLNVPDLFRYTAESLPHADIAPGGSPYFSIDGGATRMAFFSNGTFNGDGDSASHWREGTGLMDAFINDGVTVDITPIDLLLMDVIGWDVDVAYIPEPNLGNLVHFLLVVTCSLLMRDR